ncbi:MAG: hypothetical protein QW179_00960 [Candidatus Hadarchaeales archaeon]
MKIVCPRCKHEWNYRGKSKYYVTCPQCLRKIKLDEPPGRR